MEYRWIYLVAQLITVLSTCTQIILAAQSLWPNLSTEKCSTGGSLKYISGNALTDSPTCLGPNNAPYPSNVVARTFSNWNSNGSSRRGRMSQPPTLDPKLMQRALLQAYGDANEVPQLEDVRTRYSRSVDSAHQCRDTPSRLCKTRYNTTAPMYGVSLTSGQPVTIVQKFPDLLQQVVFEVCESSECDVVRGECTQTYVPYLFLVIPLGPVTLTGQDYVLVESGCVCKPKYATEKPRESGGNFIP
ncbi:uncharacterized protein LOC129770760 [Toxorhynchites rutilus septentrionalis]|uniref:uncharacterized protein LOC129770760 n=1 Tax=Toxorhynchites rutilus septentrionalis TaxID=329112 RepID=UPI002478F9A2|nr:uncharacterized protein LOC129770760 [Toxorhynchites rutilus septentrionalis]